MKRIDKKNSFVLFGVNLNKSDESVMSVKNLTRLGDKLHSKKDVKVNWLLELEILNREDIVSKVLDYKERYGDEVSCQLGCWVREWTNQELLSYVDKCMGRLKAILGYYPKAVGAWQLTSPGLKHLSEKYGVEIAFGQGWETLGVDGYSGVGSINGPYYPSSFHSLIPAQLEKNKIDVVILDTLSCDCYDTKFPLIARTTIHPWDANLPAGDGVNEQIFISDLYVKENLKRNDFGLLNVNFELDWINDTSLCNNKNKELEKRHFRWIDYMHNKGSGVEYATLSEFNRYFRSRYRNNDKIVYRISERSKYSPNTSIYWYFTKDFRIAIEYCTENHDGPETIIKTARDFRKEGKWKWSDGYDTCFYYAHAAFPEDKVRNTPVENKEDTCKIHARGGRYDAWLLSDGTAASDIEVFIDNTSIGIASGTRGVDDWCKLKSVKISPGEHTIKLINRYNPNMPWYATYVEILLTQEKNYKPPCERILENLNFIVTSDYTIYDGKQKEPVPPASDWSVKNGLSWKLDKPMKEIFLCEKGRLYLHSQGEDGKKAFIVRGEVRGEGGVGRLITSGSSIPFNVKVLRLEEKRNLTKLKWQLYDNNGDILTKTVIITPKEIIYQYRYTWKFDRLILTDAFGKEHRIKPPQEVRFRLGKIKKCTPAK